MSDLANAILTVVAIAVLGSMLVPVILLSLARVGLFHPVRLFAFGRYWEFSPRKSR